LEILQTSLEEVFLLWYTVKINMKGKEKVQNKDLIKTDSIKTKILKSLPGIGGAVLLLLSAQKGLDNTQMQKNIESLGGPLNQTELIQAKADLKKEVEKVSVDTLSSKSGLKTTGQFTSNPSEVRLQQVLSSTLGQAQTATEKIKSSNYASLDIALVSTGVSDESLIAELANTKSLTNQERQIATEAISDSTK
jgi:hypothetical protein